MNFLYLLGGKMTSNDYVEFLNSVLHPEEFNDVSLNGVQIENDNSEIKKVAFAVDSSLKSIRTAVEEGCDALVVHHGLFWGYALKIVGPHRERVKTALDGNLMLYASHIPLDSNIPYGNNAQMAYKLGMENWDGFGEFRGKTIGCIGTLLTPLTLQDILKRLGCKKSESFFIPSSKEVFSKVAICSGGSSSDTFNASSLGADLFITGEVHHQDYFNAVENDMAVLSLGHYKSETFGVKALEKLTREKFNLETLFIDGETGL